MLGAYGKDHLALVTDHIFPFLVFLPRLLLGKEGLFVIYFPCRICPPVAVCSPKRGYSADPLRVGGSPKNGWIY